MAAHIEGCEEELDDAQRVADTGLEDGGAVKLVPRWPNVKAPAVYSPRHVGMTMYQPHHTVEVWEAVCCGLPQRTHHCV